MKVGNLYIYFLLFFPSSLPLVSNGKAVSALIFVLITFILTAWYRVRLFYNDKIFMLFFVYILYLVLNVLLNGFRFQSFGNFAELYRILGVFLAFILGYSWNYRYLNIQRLLFVFIAFSIFAYLTVHVGGPVKDFYFPKDARLSWFSVGVNYVFGYSILMLFLVIMLPTTENFSRKDFLSSNVKFLKFVVLTFLLFQILTSGSRTSFLVVLLYVCLYMFLFKFKYFAFLATASIFYLSYLIAFSDIFHNEIGRLFDFLIMIITLDIESVSNIHSFAKRAINIVKVKELVSEQPYFGYGAGKNVIKVIDSSYYMTLFRYGWIGLVLEVTIIFSVAISLLLKFSKYSVMAASVLLCYYISGYTIATLYELRFSYLFFFMLGSFAMASTSLRRDVPSVRGLKGAEI